MNNEKFAQRNINWEMGVMKNNRKDVNYVRKGF
jgi:hypothetical protein